MRDVRSPLVEMAGGHQAHSGPHKASVAFLLSGQEELSRVKLWEYS